MWKVGPRAYSRAGWGLGEQNLRIRLEELKGACTRPRHPTQRPGTWRRGAGWSPESREMSPRPYSRGPQPPGRGRVLVGGLSGAGPHSWRGAAVGERAQLHRCPQQPPSASSIIRLVRFSQGHHSLVPRRSEPAASEGQTCCIVINLSLRIAPVVGEEPDARVTAGSVQGRKGPPPPDHASRRCPGRAAIGRSRGITLSWRENGKPTAIL